MRGVLPGLGELLLQPADLPGLEDPEELGLERRAQVADLVRAQRRDPETELPVGDACETDDRLGPRGVDRDDALPCLRIVPE